MTNDPVLIGSVPVQITTAGQSGMCWLCEDGQSEFCTEMFVYHGTRKLDEGLRVYRRTENNGGLKLTADNSEDYFMAVCKSGSGYLVRDVV